MQRFALNFICKNEGHIIREMLESTRSLADLIVAVDTGSSDNTMYIIKEFGLKYKIPTYVFQRPFDDFDKSRNHAIDKLMEVVKHLNWDLEDTWAFWLDCDELMQISNRFERYFIVKDLYFVKCVSEEMCYTKQLFFRLSKNFYWEGPIHEYLRTDLSGVTYDTVFGIQVQYRVMGGSWQTNLEEKFLNYAQKLTSFVQSGHKEYRWMYYIANSYVAAADSARTEERKKEFLLLAKKYYEDVLTLPSLDRDQQFTTCDKLAQCMEKMGMSWCDIRQANLKAHKADKRHAEPIARIIEYYITEGRWETAYIYSSFAFSSYHLHLPIDSDITEVRRCLYEWRILYYHYLVCMHTNREEEGRKSYKQLKERSNQEIIHLKNDELTMIRLSSPGIIGLQQRLAYFKKRIGTIFSNNSKKRLEWES